MTKYICLEGGEGTYKTTTAAALATFLRQTGATVLETKEPGTLHVPFTMKLREIMLSNEYDSILTTPARELISQAIRQIHLEKLIIPALIDESYDFIIQDRGIISGSVYAATCGNNKRSVDSIIQFVTGSMISARPYIYDHVFVFHNKSGLETAVAAKDEFSGVGDAMESRGKEFHDTINSKFYDVCKHIEQWAYVTKKLTSVEVFGKETENIVQEIASVL